MVRYDMVRYGYGMVWSGLVWFCTVFHGGVWYGMFFMVFISFYTTMVWYDMVRHVFGVVWCGVVSGPGSAGSNAPPEQHVQLRRLRPHGNQGHQ